jgi:hypothetical protein
MEKKILFSLDVMKIDIGNERNKWENLKKEIINLNPYDNVGTEAVDRAFVDLIAAIDYSKFLIKG